MLQTDILNEAVDRLRDLILKALVQGLGCIKDLHAMHRLLWMILLLGLGW